MRIIPAIDIIGGKCVRLTKGDYATQKIYNENPLEVAKFFEDNGVQYLHLVDLDAAKAGSYTLHELAASIQKTTGLKIQSGGGIRSQADVDAMVAAGIDRIVIGTLAVKAPALVAQCIQQHSAEKITVALDTRQDQNNVWQLPVKGWTENSEHDLFSMLKFYQAHGLRHLLCTDIARDGMLSGLNNDLYGQIARQFPGIAVQASGGVKTVQNIRDAKAAGAGGAILGRALLEGRFTLQEALAC